MRILNVFIKNLNSLAGEWYIDFEHPDLKSENLFLITGPTGSGKTTLLDAICLALYGCTPRLGVKGSLNITPVQEIISRHTREAMAEVAFETDKGRFTVRWSQRYASNEKEKRMSFIHSIVDENGNELSRKTTNTVKLVTELTGLSYQEFTRAVLLAQGGFAAFLTTSREEKGKLLEKLADTQIYRILSTKVHSLQKEAKERRDLLQKEFDLLPRPESPEEEQKSRQKLQEIDQNIANFESQLENIRLEIQNRENLNTARKKEEEITRQLENLNIKKFSFAEKAARLEMAEKLQPAVKLFLDFEKAENQKTAVEKSLRQTQAKLASQEKIVSGLGTEKNQAEKAENLAREEYDKNLPKYAEAQSLDGQISGMQENLDKLGREQGRRKAEIIEASQKISNMNQALENLKNKHVQVHKWLDQNRQDTWLVENFSALVERLKNLENLTSNKMAAEKNLEEGRVRLESQTEDLKELSEKLVADSNRITQLQKEEQQAEENLAKILDNVSLENLRLSLGEIQQKINKALLSASLAEQRAMLVEGEPCPLCGAIHHPWQDGQLPAHVETLEIEKKALENRIAHAEELTLEAENIRKKLDMAKSEELATREKTNATEQIKIMLNSSFANFQLELEKAMRDEEACKNSIKNDLQPFGLQESTDFKNLPEELKKRRNSWLDKNGEEQKICSDIKDMEASLSGLKDKQVVMHKLAQENEIKLDETNKALAVLRKRRFENCENPDVDEEIRKIKLALESARQKLADIAMRESRASQTFAELKGASEQLARQKFELGDYCDIIHENFLHMLKELGIEEDEFHKNRLDADEMRKLANDAAELKREEQILADRQNLARENVNLLEKTITSNDDVEILQGKFEAVRKERDACFALRADMAHNLEVWDKNRETRAEMSARLVELEKTWRKWNHLSSYIGSSKGDEFAQFAQNITLNLLIKHANCHLASLASRYQLARSGTDNLGLVVIDTFQADEQRPVSTLSGGETFLASLALALGLSALSGKKAQLGSLFLDEGFGSLDNETLDTVMSAIYNLRDSGRMIGVISHVEQMKQRISEKLEVRPLAGGQSELIGKFCSRVRPKRQAGE